jgi:hypothetical protein
LTKHGVSSTSPGGGEHEFGEGSKGATTGLTEMQRRRFHETK